MSDDIKQVIVVRKDLKMKKGKLAAQASHACMKVFFDRMVSCENGHMVVTGITPEMRSWINGIFTKVALAVNSEEELFNIYKEAELAKLPCSLIKDAGKTVFKEPTYTCVGIGPAKSEDIDKITGELKLL